jgi:hypothetical protein
MKRVTPRFSCGADQRSNSLRFLAAFSSHALPVACLSHFSELRSTALLVSQSVDIPESFGDLLFVIKRLLY